MTQVLHRSPPADVGYIVRAGTVPRLGLSEEVLGRFTTEGEAREAFLALRLSPAYRHGWAELVAVDDGSTPTPLCWFGDPSPSAAPASPSHRRSSRTTQSRAVLVENQGGTTQSKERERIAAPVTDLPPRRRSRRPGAVAALVAVLAAATLAIAAAGSRSQNTPSDRPVTTSQVAPAEPTDLPYDGSRADR